MQTISVQSAAIAGVPTLRARKTTTGLGASSGGERPLLVLKKKGFVAPPRFVWHEQLHSAQPL